MGRQNQKPGNKSQGSKRKLWVRVLITLLSLVGLWTAAFLSVIVLVAFFGWRWPLAVMLSCVLFGIGVIALPAIYAASRTKQAQPFPASAGTKTAPASNH